MRYVTDIIVITLENILLDAIGNIKITDFGLARITDQCEMMTTLCGTPHYIAPEIVRMGTPDMDNEVPTGYGPAVDMWSLGCSLYMLLTGELPFQSSERYELFQLIKQGKYTFPPHLWNGISEEAKDLIRCLLEIDPNTRITADQALAHPWVSPPTTTSTSSKTSSKTSFTKPSPVPPSADVPNNSKKRNLSAVSTDPSAINNKENNERLRKKRQVQPVKVLSTSLVT